MVIRIVDCEYNIYDNICALLVEIAETDHHLGYKTRQFSLEAPIGAVNSQEDVKHFVESELTARTNPFRNWSGLEWNYKPQAPTVV